MLAIFAAALMMAPSNGAALTPTSTGQDLTIRVSGSNFVTGDTVFVTIQYNVTEWWVKNNASIIVSHQASGNIYSMTTVNLSFNGTANYSLVLQRPMQFGDYFVWVRVANISAFKSFTVQPSILDLWDAQNKDAAARIKTDQAAGRAILVAFVAMPVGVCVAILFSYWQWRMPDPTKDEIKLWFLSKWDFWKLRWFVKDLRDLDRRRYARRNFPAIAQCAKENGEYHRKKDALLKFADAMERRVDKLTVRSTGAAKFVSDMRESAKEYDVMIAENEKAIEEQKDNAQIMALEMNHKKVRDPGLGKREMQALRVKKRIETIARAGSEDTEVGE